MSAKSRGGFGAIRAGDRWRDADGRVYVLTWVGRMGVIGYRRADDGGSGPDAVMDVLRFVARFVPSAGAHRAA